MRDMAPCITGGFFTYNHLYEHKQHHFKKCLLSVILLVLVFSFGATTAHPVIAEVTEDNKDKKYTVHQGIMDSINEKSYGMFKDSKKRNYYYLDMVSERDANKAKSDSASVELKKADQIIKGSAVGSGPIDALYSAIMDVCDVDMKLVQYDIRSVSRGREALGKVKIQVEFQGEIYIAKASDTDILKASAYAYVNAINNIVVDHLLPIK